MSYGFRAVTEGDLSLLAEWRGRSHVQRWWGPPEVEDAAETLASGLVAMWIVHHHERPFAYAQDYSPSNWDEHPFAYLPADARGIDQYIGEPDMLDCGHGSAFVRQHVERLFADGASVVGTDPHPENGRAIAAYTKAGFLTASAPRDTRWGRAVLMECWR